MRNRRSRRKTRGGNVDPAVRSLEAREPRVEEQVKNRILTISHAEFWPGITPLNVGDLEYATWISLALSCDRQVEERAEARREAERRRGRGYR